LSEKKNITIWAKRTLSLLSIAYGGLLFFLTYTSLYYEVKITNMTSFVIMEVFLTLLFGAVMLYTRKQLITSVVGLLGLLLYLPVLILYYSKENLIFLIPLGIVTILIFFFSGAGEGLKTIIGTMYLLLYIICILAYYLYISIFSGHTIDVIKAQSVSNTQAYRCYVLDITDTSKGTTKVIVEPNNYDIVYSNITFVEKAYERIVYNVRQNNLDTQIEWTQNEQGEDILLVNNEIRFKSSDALKKEPAYNFFDKNDKKKRKLKFLK